MMVFDNIILYLLYLSTSYTIFLQQTHIFKGGWLKRGVGPKVREVVMSLLIKISSFFSLFFIHSFFFFLLPNNNNNIYNNSAVKK